MTTSWKDSIDPERLAPLKNRFIVKRCEDKHITDGGIMIPETAREKPSEGIVISGSTDQIKPDDRIIFHSFAGVEHNMGDMDVLILQEKDILAVIK